MWTNPVGFSDFCIAIFFRRICYLLYCKSCKETTGASSPAIPNLAQFVSIMLKEKFTVF